MKTFFAVFCAILAAAVVIFVGLSAKARLDQWERAKQLCYTQISSELAQMDLEAKQSEAEMHRTAVLARDSGDVTRVGEITVASLERLRESQDRILEQDRLLVRILENKPFGLPLTVRRAQGARLVQSSYSEERSKIRPLMRR